MFDTTRWHSDLADQLLETHTEARDLDRKQLRLLFQVELGLYLLEVLDLLDEPISVLWAVLSGLPLPRLGDLDTDQQQQIAVARFLLPFTGRFPWHEALLTYRSLPSILCAYTVSNLPLDEQLVVNCRLTGQFDQSRRNTYERILTNRLDYRHNSRRYAEEGSARIDVYTRRGRRTVEVRLPNIAAPTPGQKVGYEGRRSPLVISYAMLEETAQQLDDRLVINGETPQWLDRLHRYIHYCAFDADGYLSAPNTVPLHLEGMNHIVGMVGSGKSTLMKLIAAYLILFETNKSVTLVLGDTLSVLDLADELNRLLAETERPIAVPLIGRTTRDEHLKRLYSSGSDLATHWGGRWLSTTCPLMGLIPPEQLMALPAAPVPGREPCEQIDVSKPDSKYPSLRLCPLFHGCPSQQVWHDLADARIYITTPGAMAKSTVPTQFDNRRLKYGEWIYEKCDLVIFDEVDTVMEWFDNEYASVIDLWGKTSALFTKADVAAAESLAVGTSLAEERWVRAERHTTEAIVNILRQLSGGGDGSTLRRWVGGRYFTAFNLFNRLARRLLGIWDYAEDHEISDDQTSLLKDLLAVFDEMTDGDPLMIQRPNPNEPDLIYRLAQTMGRALANGAEAIVPDCEDWIATYIPDFENRLTNLNRILESHQEPTESLGTLALKLALALNVALLDRNIRIVFYEWYNQPEAVDREIGTQPYRPSAIALSEALPIPPTGRIFGTYYARSPESDGDDTNALARFEYANIGRWYLLNYHRLLAPLGIPGPHVIGLSGTSWLPDSTRWHVEVPPIGILQSEMSARHLITMQSQYFFRPQYDTKGDPISISGQRDKIAATRKMAQAMIRSNEIERELNELTELAETDPDLWGDRKRILFLTNSYTQAKAFAETIGSHWVDKSEVFYLARPDESGGEDLLSVGHIPRGEIEKFALTTGRILVAPMNAIGRGYNILNRDRDRAAFGSVYFLIRPMPHPFDIQALAGELNAWTLKWCDDPSFGSWQHPRLIDQATEFRRYTKYYWTKAEMRRFYRDMSPNEREDLAATTLGKIIQAAGRLLRGGVPFRASFVDARWAPGSAAAPPDTPHNAKLDHARDSLLTQMVLLLERYSADHTLGESLYEPFAGLLEIDNFYPKRNEE
jgi:hypothetical protein